MQRVQTSRWHAPPPTLAWTRCRFGRHVRFVLLFAWLTLCPVERRLPHTSQVRAMCRPTYRAGAAGSSPTDAPQKLARRDPRDDGDALDAPPGGLDLGPADDLVRRPVGALHEHVGQELGDERARRVVAEEDQM